MRNALAEPVYGGASHLQHDVTSKMPLNYIRTLSLRPKDRLLDQVSRSCHRALLAEVYALALAERQSQEDFLIFKLDQEIARNGFYALPPDEAHAVRKKQMQLSQLHVQLEEHFKTRTPPCSTWSPSCTPLPTYLTMMDERLHANRVHLARVLPPRATRVGPVTLDPFDKLGVVAGHATHRHHAEKFRGFAMTAYLSTTTQKFPVRSSLVAEPTKCSRSHFGAQMNLKRQWCSKKLKSH